MITHVDAVAIEADSKFPELKDNEWTVTEQSDIHENNGIKFRFTTYKRIK